MLFNSKGDLFSMGNDDFTYFGTSGVLWHRFSSKTDCQKLANSLIYSFVFEI